MDPDVYDHLAAEVDYFIHRICSPSWLIEEGTIDFVDITYVVHGRAEYTVNARTYAVSAGDLLCIPRGSRRSAVSFPSDLMECFSINGHIFTPRGVEVDLPLPIVHHIGMRPEIIALYQEMNAEWLLRDQGYGLRVHALYLMILQRLFQLIVYKNDRSLIDNRIRRVLKYMIDHYSEPLTVQSMADHIGLSPMYFGNFFKKETGVTFRQYLTSIRLNHAEDMLRSGEYNVNEVSSACGFCDIFYFSKVFKQSRGVSPSQVVRESRP